MEALEAMKCIYVSDSPSEKEIEAAVCSLCGTKTMPDPVAIAAGLERWALVLQGEKSQDFWQTPRLPDTMAWHGVTTCSGCHCFGLYGMCRHSYASFILTGVLESFSHFWFGSAAMCVTAMLFLCYEQNGVISS